MIIRINGDVSQYYVQTLCLVFFPGAKFREDEAADPNTPRVTVSVRQYKNGNVKATVEIKVGEKCTRAEEVATPSSDLGPERTCKIAVGRAMFSAGKEHFGHIHPWGILTGVRPAKVATELIEKGNGIIRSKRILRDEYFLNPQKAALAVSVANTEMALTKKLPNNLCSIYISIPFCPSRCAYCSFVSYTSSKLLSLIDEYLEKLYVDLENMVHIIANKNRDLMRKVEVVSKRSIREKLLTYLSIQAQAQDSRYVEIPLGRVELAEYLCVDRSALTRELAKMKAEGLIDYDRNCFRLN